MLAFLLIAQLGAITPDSSYTSEQLRAFVAEASRRNRDVPAGLTAYRATVESEIAIVGRRAEGMEGVVSLEQVQNEVRWRVPGDFEQRVIGYRSQSLGLQFSSLGFMTSPWTVPILYGNRLSILFGRDTSRRTVRRQQREPMSAIHPLAADRDRVYRFSGGDTVITMRVGDRELPIVRVTVEPRTDLPPRTVVFRGELDLDATRHQLVRMRGYFVAPRPARPNLALRAFALSGFQAIAFVELENGEFEGRYWLPTYQRWEAQAAWTAATDARNIFRIVSRYRQHQVNDTVIVARVDSLVPSPYRLARVAAESLAAFREWRRDLGDLTSGVHSDDFDDLAPDVWRPTGAPRTDFRVPRVMDALRVNRIEGAFTGWGVQHRFRDAFPGLVLQGTAGWAWSEQVVRGRASAQLERGAWTTLVRAGRSLDITNDFRSAFDSGSTLGAVFGVDDYDYVDRRLAAVGVHRRVGQAFGTLRMETGPVRDAHVVPHLSRGLFRGDSGFRDNRGVDPGTWWRTWASFEFHPDVNAEFMRTGIGGLVNVEHGVGDLRFTRLDARVMARSNRGRLTLVARGDLGLLFGDSVPPQQLFEVGRNQRLQGYGYKEFVGDRAAMLRGLTMYRLPVLEAPIPLGRFLLPGLSPALAFGAQAAVTELSGTGAQQANWRLATRVEQPPPVDGSVPLGVVVPVARATDGIRTSITVGLRFFGGAIGVGAARATDRSGPWKLRVDFGQVI
ncbi:MAG: hypothetical protein IPK85_07450 [Gemmatimonadetes bacterium]|nr:hypothetical protein [Gemmatimonadota bacterium]